MGKRLFEIQGNDLFATIVGGIGGWLDRQQDALYGAVGNAASGVMASFSSLGDSIGGLFQSDGPSVSEPKIEAPTASPEHATAMKNLEAALGIESPAEISAPGQSPQGVQAPQQDKGFDRAEWDLAEAMRNRGGEA